MSGISALLAPAVYRQAATDLPPPISQGRARRRPLERRAGSRSGLNMESFAPDVPVDASMSPRPSSRFAARPAAGWRRLLRPSSPGSRRRKSVTLRLLCRRLSEQVTSSRRVQPAPGNLADFYREMGACSASSASPQPMDRASAALALADPHRCLAGAAVAHLDEAAVDAVHRFFSELRLLCHRLDSHNPCSRSCSPGDDVASHAWSIRRVPPPRQPASSCACDRSGHSGRVQEYSGSTAHAAAGS